MKGITKALVQQAFTRMGELALDSGIKLEVSLYGGTLMMLAYDIRASTRDVDAIVRPAKEGMNIANKVGRELGLPEGWLNDDVKMFLGPSGKLRELPLEIPGLMITAPTASYLLAMKALACRDPLPGYAGDHEDLKFLIHKLEIKTVEDVQGCIDKYYPDDVLLPKHASVIETLIEEVKNDQGH